MRTGVSVATAVTYATDMLGITANTTFLLLDLRDADEYAMWHIKESIKNASLEIACLVMNLAILEHQRCSTFVVPLAPPMHMG